MQVRVGACLPPAGCRAAVRQLTKCAQHWCLAPNEPPRASHKVLVAIIQNVPEESKAAVLLVTLFVSVGHLFSARWPRCWVVGHRGGLLPIRDYLCKSIISYTSGHVLTVDWPPTRPIVCDRLPLSQPAADHFGGEHSRASCHNRR
jgi:hypothetical protein